MAEFYTELRVRSQKDSRNCTIHRQHPRLCKPRGKAKDDYHCMFDLIQVWLGRCFDSHPLCAESILPEAQSSIVPTRLVDVGSLDPPREPHLVKYRSLSELLKATESARYPGYATLSYCWGQTCDNAFVLRQENESRLLGVIPSASLPRTINDAIHICRRIGIQCIWIDALCIQQGSDGQSLDWQEESTRIGIYYNNALVTIADTWASSNTQGCLPRSRWQNENNVVWSYTKDTASAILDAIFLQDLSSFSDIDGRRENRRMRAWAEIDHCELLKRGWVAQEIAFSTRILWFTKTGVYWQCNEELKADWGGPFKHGTIPSIGSKDSKTLSLAASLRKNPAHAQWYRIVQHYAGMALSYENDRLPALSGLCKYFDQHTEDRYLAGLWASSLVYGLSWNLNGVFVEADKHVQFPRIENTPSWSWISRKDKIEFQGQLECKSIDCKIGSFEFKEADVRLQYADSHGQVAFASIRVQAPIQRWEITHGECHHIRAPDTDSSFSLYAYNTRFDDAPFGNPYQYFSPWIGSAILLSHACHVPGKCVMEFILLLVDPVAEDTLTYRRAGIMRIDRSHLKYSRPDLLFLIEKNFGSDSVQEITLV